MKLLRLRYLGSGAVGLLFACGIGAQADRDIRMPAVSGQFYPSDQKRLRQAIAQFLQDAVTARIEKPVALVVPHAGYIYSGQVAADGYRQVRDLQPDVVVILGTNHADPGFRDISVWARGSYRTPLGDAPIDETLAAMLLAANTDCRFERGVHLREHSVEVQVPFVQTVFPRARIVPVVIGAPDPAMCSRFGATLAKVLKERRALIVASSDLSHYPAYGDANQADRETLEAVTALDVRAFDSRLQTLMGRGVRGLDTCACGAGPIMAAMAAAKGLGAVRGIVVSYANSGDVLVGDRSRVVGYGAVVMAAGGEGPPGVFKDGAPTAPVPEALAASDKRTLLAFARKTLQSYLATETLPLARNFPPRLQALQGAFVTLKKHGSLRGCIGHMAADTALGQVVGAMAMEAAFNDLRFSPLAAADLRDVEIEISVLTPFKPITSAAEIKLGRDGVILHKGDKSAVFLPQVATENGWDLPEMMENLCLKAGLPAGGWKQGARLFIFQTEVFSESEFR